MAQHESTINVAPGFNSSGYTQLDWSSFDSGANDIYIDVTGVTSEKMLILLAGHSTLVTNTYIGTSDSRSSQTSKAYPFSAGKLGRLKVRTTASTRADPSAKFLSTVVANTEVWAIHAMGPFETARFADSRGYIKVCRGKVDAGGVSQSSDEQQICAILIP